MKSMNYPSLPLIDRQGPNSKRQNCKKAPAEKLGALLSYFLIV